MVEIRDTVLESMRDRGMVIEYGSTPCFFAAKLFKNPDMFRMASGARRGLQSLSLQHGGARHHQAKREGILL